MGNLITDTPYSEVTATLEVLDRLGIERNDLKDLRRSTSMQQKVAAILTVERLRPFTIWKTLTRPMGASAKNYLASYEKKGITVSDWANDIIRTIDFSAGHADVDIVRVTMEDLGFNRATRRDTIYERALSFGLQLLPHWTAPELRDTYEDQPRGEWLVAGMEPITDSGGSPGLFRIGRRGDGTAWLEAAWGRPGKEWGPESVVLFALPRR